ncbi:DUF2797 domain-containing protein [Streptomyces sp. V4-01]|uniref:DUF2797 domain-containing protein n=1 Tax=Actinacidiphila polyblastidii TaxID=3110430 RepID=A0ABU7PGL6_9ACTN|nr:DUF2797 domain-containing protein [Streptomyces sp. V4-01]
MWRCAGLRWRGGGPAWAWWHPEHGERSSPQPVGSTLAFALAHDAERRCTGVRRGSRRLPCPYAAAVPSEARRDQCEECSALDRSSSVAADTRADDPQPYAVYLACFGPGLHKVGITAVARGDARLLEQGALAFTFLGQGPLMTARRTEAVLGAALGVPDRVRSAAKSAARREVPPAAEREESLRQLHASVLALRDRLPSSLGLLPLHVVDHAARFGLRPGAADRAAPVAEVTAMAPGSALRAEVTAVVGHDLELRCPDGRVLLLDARLASGWPLHRAAPDAVPRVLTRPLPTAVAPPLF